MGMKPARPGPLPQPHRCPSNSVTTVGCVLVCLARRAPVGIGGDLVGEGGLYDIGLLLRVYRTVP